MAALSEMDARLAPAVRRRGVATDGWRPRTMTGELHYIVSNIWDMCTYQQIRTALAASGVPDS
eukprot:3116527-Alexandrium_andersonii.AAC.1